MLKLFIKFAILFGFLVCNKVHAISLKLDFKLTTPDCYQNLCEVLQILEKNWVYTVPLIIGVLFLYFSLKQSYKKVSFLKKPE